MDWRMVWKLPLVADRMGYAYDSEGVMALTAEGYEDEDMKMIADVVAAVNGEKEFENKGGWTADGCDIFHNNQPKFCVRGWGELTSPGCCNLSNEEAAKTQDGFINFILEKLN